MPIHRWAGIAARRLRAARLKFGHGADSPESEAAWIAAHVCRLSPRNIEKHLTRPLSLPELSRADVLVDRRIRERIPLAYLLKEAWLGKHRFYVDQRVIVPRSFIAVLIEEGLRPWIPAGSAPTRGLDMCTGSGCLAILMAQAFPAMKVDAVDLSEDALEVAKINMMRFGTQSRLRLIKSDLFSAVPKQQRYDVIVSNPPYVMQSKMRSLPAEYRHEPRQALFGGTDGLTIARRIVSGAGKFLRPEGVLIMEIGHNKRAFERAFPRLPMVWLDTPGGTDVVALIEAEHLRSSVRR